MLKLPIFRQRKGTKKIEYILSESKGGSKLKFTYNNEDKSLTLNISEEIDHHIAEKIRNRADFEIQKYMPKSFIIDFKNVSFMDSAGIRNDYWKV